MQKATLTKSLINLIKNLIKDGMEISDINLFLKNSFLNESGSQLTKGYQNTNDVFAIYDYEYISPYKPTNECVAFDDIRKSDSDEFKDIIKAIVNKIISNDLEKGKKFPIGTIHNWGGKDFKKIDEGKWEEVKKPKMKTFRATMGNTHVDVTANDKKEAESKAASKLALDAGDEPEKDTLKVEEIDNGQKYAELEMGSKVLDLEDGSIGTISHDTGSGYKIKWENKSGGWASYEKAGEWAENYNKDEKVLQERIDEIEKFIDMTEKFRSKHGSLAESTKNEVKQLVKELAGLKKQQEENKQNKS